MLFDKSGLMAFAEASVVFRPMLPFVEEMAEWAAGMLGEKRRGWLRSLPRTLKYERFALVHASPHDLWRAPMPDAPDDELAKVFGQLSRPCAVYGHIHRPYVRTLNLDGVLKIVANAGSAGLPLDGDDRAAYLVVDDGKPETRRVSYDVGREIKRLRTSSLPHAAWVIRMLQTASPQLP